MKKVSAWGTGCMFAMGIAIFISNGFGVPIMRSYGGDAVVVWFLYFFLSLTTRASVLRKSLFVIGFSVGIELLQLFFSGSLTTNSTVVELFVGSTFDWIDIAVYSLALLLVAGGELLLRNKVLNKQQK